MQPIDSEQGHDFFLWLCRLWMGLDSRQTEKYGNQNLSYVFRHGVGWVPI